MPVLMAALALGLLTTLAGVMRDKPATVAPPTPGASPAGAAPTQTRVDVDGDGLDDLLEDTLAERFAPVVYHGEKEVNFPVSVDWWLARTQLSMFDSSASPRAQLIASGPLDQKLLLDVHLRGAPARTPIALSSARSRMKQLSFFLHDVAVEFRAGQPDPASWITYVHSYPNEGGGVTVQYWRAYTWNHAHVAAFEFSHGGDWEQVSVHLNAAHEPESVAYMQHSGIAHHRNNAWEGTHPVVYSQEGGHSSAPDPGVLQSSRMIRQETWTGGQTTWFTGARRKSGGLVNVGEKSRPRNQQVFNQYAGLWGSPGRFFITSGYWGPAFNETGSECADGTRAYGFPFSYAAGRRSCGRIFIRAWCEAMAADRLDLSRECYASEDVP
jgi:hypothetical protein